MNSSLLSFRCRSNLKARLQRTHAALGAMLVLLGGLAISPAALAQWNEVAKARNGDVWLMDAATARRTGNLVRAWVLINHPMPITNPPPYALSGVRSTRAIVQIDCRDQRARRLEASFFSLSGGDGRLLGTSDGDDWFNVPPDTPDSELLKIACDLPDQAPPPETPPAATPAATTAPGGAGGRTPTPGPPAPAAPARRPG